MSRSTRQTSLVVFGLLALPQIALAEAWYYSWTCLGPTCPASQGHEGPYPSFMECEDARTHDPRYWSSMGDEAFYSLLGVCEEASPQAGSVYVPVAEPKSTTQMTELEYGLSVGPGWSLIEPGGSAGQSSPSLGFSFDAHAGQDLGGAFFLTGLSLTRLSSPMLGAGAHTYLVIPVIIGGAITPKIVNREGFEFHLDLGAGYGGFAQLACSGCVGGTLDDVLGFGYTLKAGFDVFFAKNTGLSVDLLFNGWSMTDSTSGLTVKSPPWMLRISHISRPQ